jgi:hypothetical protein
VLSYTRDEELQSVHERALTCAQGHEFQTQQRSGRQQRDQEQPYHLKMQESVRGIYAGARCRTCGRNMAAAHLMQQQQQQQQQL